MKTPSYRTLTVALLGASALAAQAQVASPNVTLYGLIDVAVETVSNVSGVGSINRIPSNVGMSPSSFGIKGTEDLGGGLSAIFNLESGFTPDTGSMAQGGRLFGRQANVGLVGPWGQVLLGRNQSSFYWSIWDSNVMSSALYSLTSLDSYVPNARADNSIAYRGTFSGLTLAAEYSLGRDTVNAGPSPVGTNCAGETGTDVQACRQWSATVKYDTDDWGATATYDSQHGRTLTSATDAVFGGLTSSNKTDNRLLLAGYVKFSGIKLGGGLIRRNNDGSATKPHSDQWYVGAAYPLTPQLTLTGLVTTLRYKDISNYNATLMSAQLAYSLSKRTVVYGQIGHINNDKLSTVSVSSGGSGSSNPAAGGAQNGLSAGIRHFF
jgi:predicted porin